MSFADFENLWYMVLAERMTSMSFITTMVLLAIICMFVIVFIVLLVKFTRWMEQTDQRKTSGHSL